MFSAGKLVATDWRARLGDDLFEELQIMKFAWKNSIVDLASWNSQEVEEVDMTPFETLLKEEVSAAEWGREFGF